MTVASDDMDNATNGNVENLKAEAKKLYHLFTFHNVFETSYTELYTSIYLVKFIDNLSLMLEYAVQRIRTSDQDPKGGF